MASRGWCFTLHDYDEKDESFVQAVVCQYMVYGHEECPDTGRKHLQGYVYFPKRGKRFKGVKALFPRETHIEAAKGSPSQNKAYCTKSDKEGFFEFGDLPAQGKRSDIDDVREWIEQGDSMRQIVKKARSYQSMKAAEMILKYSDPIADRRDVEVYWFWGPTGAGKSHTARAEAGPPASVFTAHATGQWWDGYDNHPVILIDDYRTNFCTFSWLLRLLDVYAMQLPIKGGFRDLRATKIYITSPKNPEETWSKRTPEDLQQLLRRIKEVRYFGPRDLGEVRDAPRQVVVDDYEYQAY